MPAFSHLVRFIAQDGQTYYGDAILPSGTSDIAKAKQARVITGDIFGEHDVTDKVAAIKSLLSPLPPTSVRTVRCLGLNYATHAKESNLPPPKYPVLFYKPPTSLSTTPFSPIPIPLAAQEHPGLDYECELVVVIGRTCLNATPETALDYVLGYAVGNDVSHREWQLKLGGGQWGLGKGFDGWGVWGPGVVTKEGMESGMNSGSGSGSGGSGKEKSEGKGLGIGTKVNGREMQRGKTGDMIFGVRETVAFLSRGVTLMAGDLIFMGTPSGVAAGRTPPAWLKHGDVVEVSLEGVGSCTNSVEFVKSGTSKL